MFKATGMQMCVSRLLMAAVSQGIELAHSNSHPTALSNRLSTLGKNGPRAGLLKLETNDFQVRFRVR